MGIDRRVAALLCCVCAPALLSGCGSVRDALGMGKKAPDEFAVVSRAPLSMPPDAALRPPRPGEPRPQELEPKESARQTVFGTSVGEARQAILAASSSPGEAALLVRAGADVADPEIRRKVDRETAALVEEDASLTDTLLFWQGDRQPPATVVNAAAEAERLRRNSALGLPPNEGETPMIDSSSGALF